MVTSFYIFSSDPHDIVFVQIKNILAPGVADPHGQWRECKLDIKNCSPGQLSVMQGEYFLILITMCLIEIC